MTRRGLSPLIATILLIAFAVALGMLIMSWTFGLGGGDAGPCAEVALELQEIPGGKEICYDTTGRRLRFFVKNAGEDPIPVLLLAVIDQQHNQQEKRLPVDLQPGLGIKVELPITTSAPQSVAARILPFVVVDGEQVACPQQEIEQVSVPVC